MISEVSRRYAKALFELAKETKQVETIAPEIHGLKLAIENNKEILGFIASPLVSAEDKKAAIQKTFSSANALVLNLMLLMAEKGRLELIGEVADAFEQINDESHGITRGKVVSAKALGAQERADIEKTINKVTKKEVILSYEEDPSLLGGLIAQVGGWNFDDSLKSHLHRMSEELNRRSN
ncbi:MAG: ATP synthase subunit delta [Oligoflexia bacterium]|nr:MAG: ATP synthase subunit delta [Oligoflexia bacterium]